MTQSRTSIDLIEQRLAHGLPDEVFAIQAVCEGARRWSEHEGQSMTINRVIVHPNPDWTAYLTDDEYQAFEALRAAAYQRCAAGDKANPRPVGLTGGLTT